MHLIKSLSANHNTVFAFVCVCVFVPRVPGHNIIICAHHAQTLTNMPEHKRGQLFMLVVRVYVHALMQFMNIAGNHRFLLRLGQRNINKERTFGGGGRVHDKVFFWSGAWRKQINIRVCRVLQTAYNNVPVLFRSRTPGERTDAHNRRVCVCKPHVCAECLA